MRNHWIGSIILGCLVISLSGVTVASPIQEGEMHPEVAPVEQDLKKSQQDTRVRSAGEEIPLKPASVSPVEVARARVGNLGKSPAKADKQPIEIIEPERRAKDSTPQISTQKPVEDSAVNNEAATATRSGRNITQDPRFIQSVEERSSHRIAQSSRAPQAVSVASSPSIRRASQVPMSARHEDSSLGKVVPSLNKPETFVALPAGRNSSIEMSSRQPVEFRGTGESHHPEGAESIVRSRQQPQELPGALPGSGTSDIKSSQRHPVEEPPNSHNSGSGAPTLEESKTKPMEERPEALPPPV